MVTAVSDGAPAFEEVNLISGLVAMHPVFLSLSDAHGLGMHAWDRVREQGAEACLRDLGLERLDQLHRELAFSLCVRVMKVDGVVAAEEALVLGTMQEIFGFSPALVKSLIIAT